MRASSETASPRPIPARFRVSRRTLWAEHLMRQCFRLGALAVVIAVAGMFFLLFMEIDPLLEANEDGTARTKSFFSLLPLAFGSIKGAIYAMAFALPIALLSAIYCAAFVTPAIRQWVKTLMEIMASFPAVVLGLTGAWIVAPFIETRIPGVLLAAILVPATVLIAGWLWSHMPHRIRACIPTGTEWAALIPIATAAITASWFLGPWLEASLFFVRDADGSKIADFRIWWTKITGSNFSANNSLVVGFMMGFAVIPTIFTIAEEALSDVPPSLVAASQALGATRWQTARTILIPLASAGMFSAVMLGFGRAIGETMIMIMITGNTPMIDWNPFDGMRSLAASIALDLPGASPASAPYRHLILATAMLFVFTFVINTIAEILRLRLRGKFRVL